MKHLVAAELKNWSQTSENSNSLLPLLLKRLIINAVGINNIDEIDFPGRRSITIKKSFDGTLRIKNDFLFFKKDTTYRFEFGQNDDTKNKFLSDFDKRTRELNNKNTEDVFVFVSTAWQSVNKTETVGEAVKKYDPGHLWHNVRILDADDIETMLDMDFATTAWLLQEMGMPHIHFDGADYFWKKWISSTKYPLDEKIILSRNDFDDNRRKIVLWLFSQTDILYISAEGYEEAILYFIAAIKDASLEQNFKESILQKICIVHDKNVWKEITQTKSSSNLILIPSFGIPEDLSFLQQNNMKIIVPFDAANKNTIYLEKLNILKIKQMLIENGYDDLRSFNGTSLLSLQRELLSEAKPLPNWLRKEEDKYFLFKLAMIGKWDCYSAKDLSFISELCNKPYSEIESFIKRLSFEEEAPIKKKNHSYEIISRKIIIKNILAFLSEENIIQVVQKLLSVFEKYDEKFDLASEERFYASLQKSSYSENLKNGISNGLAYLSNNGSKEIVSTGISKILENNWKKMATIEPYFSILVEAAPETFLKWFEDCLKIDVDNPLRDLYKKTENDNPFFIGSSSYAGFLFGLEKLAWKKRYFKRVVYILLKWSALAKDEKAGLSNSPERSLQKLFRPFLPQTELAYNEIYAILDGLKKEENYSALFEILYPLLPTNRSEILNDSTRPVYIDFTRNENVDSKEMNKYSYNLFEYVIVISEYNPEKWKKLLSHIHCIFEKDILKKIKEIDFSSTSDTFKTSIRLELTRKKEWWEKYGDGNRDEAIRDYSDVISIIPHTEDISEYIYTFSKIVISTSDEKNQEMQTALSEINKKFGIKGIIELSKMKDINVCSMAYQTALFFLSNDQKSLELLNQALIDDAPIQFIRILVQQISFKQGFRWLNNIDVNIVQEEKFEEMLLVIYPSIEFWKWLDENNFYKGYWKYVSNLYLKDQDEYDFAYKKLLEEENYNQLLHIFVAKSNLFNVKDAEKINVLLKMKNVPDAYYVSLIINDLRKSQSVSIEALVSLEMKYIKYIEECNGEKGVPPTLKAYLQDNPLFFVELVNILFKPDDESASNSTIDENLKEIVKNIYIPLSKTFLFRDETHMNAWLDEVFDKLSNIGKTNSGEIMIGNILSNAPDDPEDGVWSIKYVRDYIENHASETMLQQISYEKSSWSASAVAGEPCQELIDIGEKYGADASFLEVNYPRISDMLKTLEHQFIDMGKKFGDL